LILIDDNPENRNLDLLEDIKRKFKINKMILNGSRLGIEGSVQEAWRNVPDKCDFIWHQENDFTYNEEIDLSVFIKVLSNRHIFQVALLRQAWYENEIEKGGIFKANHSIFRNANYKGVDLVLHRGFFTHNPSLYRKSIINSEFPNYNEYSFVKHLLSNDSNGWCSYYGKTSDGPRVTHIGEIKI
jgi:hypothetical protein